MTLVWNGTQADGTNGSSTIGLVLDLTTGEAVELARLFDDADAAFAALEKRYDRVFRWETCMESVIEQI